MPSRIWFLRSIGRSFLLLTFGQFFSSIGTEVTQYSFSLDAFGRTQSVATLAALAVAVEVPKCIAALFSGSAVDMFGAKNTMVAADTIAVLCSVVAMTLSSYTTLSVIMTILSIASFCDSMQWPAFDAAIALSVPKKHLSSANGVGEAAEAIAELVAPAIAAYIITTFGPQAVMALDVFTYGIALMSFGQTKVTKLDLVKRKKPAAGPTAMMSQVFGGFQAIKRSPQLTIAICWTFLGAFAEAAASILFVPLVLSVAPMESFGIVTAIVALGMLLGGAIVAVFDEPANPWAMALLCAIVQGGISGAAICGQATIIRLCIFGSIWYMSRSVQRSVLTARVQEFAPPELVGRVLAAKEIVDSLGVTAAAAILAPESLTVAQYVFVVGAIHCCGSVACWYMSRQVSC